MIWAIFGLALLVVSAAGAAAVLAYKLADERIARAAAERDHAAAVTNRDQARVELAEVRDGAAATVKTLRAEIEEMEHDLESCSDPVARRARWGRLLATADAAVSGVLERDPGVTSGTIVVPAGGRRDAASDAAGRGADRPDD